MSSRTTWRFRVWYALFLACVLAGVVLLDHAIAREDRPIAFALILTGLVGTVALGAARIIRIIRRP